MPIEGLSIKSVVSGRELVLHGPRPFEFTAELRGGPAMAMTDVYSPPDYNYLAGFLEELAALDAPWKEARRWSSLDKELRLSATCTSLGRVQFTVQLEPQLGGEEGWSVTADIAYDFGMLPSLALDARRFCDRLSALSRL